MEFYISDKAGEGMSLFAPVGVSWGGDDRCASRLAGLEPGALVSKSAHPYTRVQIKTCVLLLPHFPTWLPRTLVEREVSWQGLASFLHLVAWRGAEEVAGKGQRTQTRGQKAGRARASDHPRWLGPEGDIQNPRKRRPEEVKQTLRKSGAWTSFY